MLNGIYIHIPFCLNKCNYCDFLSFKSTVEEREKYVTALIEEINMYPKFSLNTVYFGGGTPSLLTPEQVSRILSNLNISENAEITLEVNPKTVNLEKFKSFRKSGINRVSIGIQSFDSENLKTLGRMHSSAEGEEAFFLARKAGFENISLDLMFSLPNQSLENLKFDLKKLFSLKPEHFSIYSLIWEEGTEFFTKLEKGEYKETDNDLEASMYEVIIEEAEKQGYIQYEISNFCLPGKRALHNTKYWKNEEYLGVGLGASGYYNDIRYKNDLTFPEYYGKISNGIKPIFEEEFVSPDEKEVYEYILGLRVIPDGIFPKGKSLSLCETLVEKGFLIKKNANNYTLSKKGILMANDVFSEFI
ncbi:radical SAM family heme chaperone HemW [uncultured Cetobacterium sp.]|uniref:radical SAM family heme chaperone HemW n=1 Tax=uncultured Cetobacterium sp. TaxID=527638 RepID=UPI0026351B3E|nr:radical SAM family heme chaperone HemW [uncultured Cetobacterium sp.]